MQVRRYQKRRTGYVFHSKFIVPSDEQALELASVLTRWCADAGGDDDDSVDDNNDAES